MHQGKKLKIKYQQLMADALREERLKRKKTIFVLAESAGINRQELDQIEVRQIPISWKNAAKLLDYFNKDIEIRLIDRPKP